MLRSTRRYVASAMDTPPWRVRFELDTRFKRPVGLVSAASAGGITASGVDTVALTEALSIQLWPEVGANGSENKLLAERAAEKLVAALLVGVTDDDAPEVRGYRELIPLWAYTDDEGNPLPIEGEGGVATRRFVCDFMRVLPGWTVQTMPEAPDDQLYVATCDLRVQLFRNARLAVDGPMMESVELDVSATAA